MQIDDETLAKLILSVGTRKKWRAMPPITTAKLLEKLCRESSVKEVAKGIDVNPETIRMFLRLLTLPDTIQKLVEEGKIGKDIGDRISRFPDPRDQVILAKALIDRKVTATEIKNEIKSFKMRNPEISISECIELTIKYRAIIEEEHLVISRIRETTLNGLKLRSEADGISVGDLITEILKETIPTEKGFLSADIIDNMIVLGLKSEGFNALEAESVKSEVKLNALVDTLIDKWLIKGD